MQITRRALLQASSLLVGCATRTKRDTDRTAPRPNLAAAQDIARWLGTTAQPTAAGVTWPADPDQPKRMDPRLYAGAAGVVLFLVELHRYRFGGRFRASRMNGDWGGECGVSFYATADSCTALPQEPPLAESSNVRMHQLVDTTAKRNSWLPFDGAGTAPAGATHARFQCWGNHDNDTPTTLDIDLLYLVPAVAPGSF